MQQTNKLDWYLDKSMWTPEYWTFHFKTMKIQMEFLFTVILQSFTRFWSVAIFLVHWALCRTLEVFLANHAFMKLTLCKGALSCWNVRLSLYINTKHTFVNFFVCMCFIDTSTANQTSLFITRHHIVCYIRKQTCITM